MKHLCTDERISMGSREDIAFANRNAWNKLIICGRSFENQQNSTKFRSFDLFKKTARKLLFGLFSEFICCVAVSARQWPPPWKEHCSLLQAEKDCAMSKGTPREGGTKDNFSAWIICHVTLPKRTTNISVISGGLQRLKVVEGIKEPTLCRTSLFLSLERYPILILLSVSCWCCRFVAHFLVMQTEMWPVSSGCLINITSSPSCNNLKTCYFSRASLGLSKSFHYHENE